LEIELWKIGDSPPAPKFNIICKPNDWTREFKAQSVTSASLSNTRRLQLDFWTAFKAWAESQSDLRLQKPLPQGWIASTIGRAYFHVNGIVSTWNSQLNKELPQVRVELAITSQSAKEDFRRLKEQELAIQELIDIPLVWHSPEGNKSAKVYVATDLDFLDKEQWPAAFAWLAKYMQKFRDVFGPLILAS
jgi:hypothetical protein